MPGNLDSGEFRAAAFNSEESKICYCQTVFGNAAIINTYE